MNESPLVSICIPTYNGDIYIKECLNSAINQTYENIEIIISDDNSQDNTMNICNTILSKTNIDYKIITNNSSGGVADNWNNSIKYSSGQYIKMLFQDDYLYPDCIEKMISLAKICSTADPLIISTPTAFFPSNIILVTRVFVLIVRFVLCFTG